MKEGGLRLKGQIKGSSEKDPLITIVTVVFNGQQNIETTITSVLNLSYKNWEYIVIDGGSTDQTVEILSRYNDKIDYWISEKDRGIYDAMNKGIDLAGGYWINFMNCGDRFADKNVLDIFSIKRYDADIIYGDALVEYDAFRTLFHKVPLEKMWQRISFCHQASFTRSSLLKNWKFDLQYKLSSDFDLLYRAYIDNKKFTYSNTIICFFDFKGGATKSNALRSIQERRRIVLSRAFSFKKWGYYNFSIFYVYLAFNLKRLLGNKLTLCITRLLKG